MAASAVEDCGDASAVEDFGAASAVEVLNNATDDLRVASAAEDLRVVTDDLRVASASEDLRSASAAEENWGPGWGPDLGPGWGPAFIVAPATGEDWGALSAGEENSEDASVAEEDLVDAPDKVGVGSLECGNICCLLRGLSASAEDFWASSCFLVSYLAAFCLAFLAALLVCLVTSPVTHLSTLVADMESSGWAGTSSVMSSTWQLVGASAEDLTLIPSWRDSVNSP